MFITIGVKAVSEAMVASTVSYTHLLLGACSDDGELNGAVEADNLELSKNELKLSNVAGSSTVDITATADLSLIHI